MRENLLSVFTVCPEELEQALTGDRNGKAVFLLRSSRGRTLPDGCVLPALEDF